jgi:DNA replication protein DnaC
MPSENQQTDSRPWPAGVARADWSHVDSRVADGIRQAVADDNYPILIGGDVGRGKSCMAALIWQSYCRHMQRRPLFFECSALVNHLLESRCDGSTLVRRWNGELRDYAYRELQIAIDLCPCLVIDDLGVTTLTANQSDALLQAINLRHGKPLVVTTNCTESTLAEMVGERISSRLRAGYAFRLGGPDRRISK